MARRQLPRLSALVLAALLAGAASADTEANAQDGDVGPQQSGVPVHWTLGGGVVVPWDGDTGFNVATAVHAGLAQDRIWLGAEFEYRRFEADYKPFYEPDLNSWLLRFSFQYHPFPRWVVSPYVGVGVGIAIHKVDDNHSSSDPSDRIRKDVSAGTSLQGVAGLEAPLLGTGASLFAEARIDTTSDIWHRTGGNWQSDQVGGFMGMGGLRFRFD